MSGRDCSFASQNNMQTVSPSDISLQGRATSPGDSCSQPSLSALSLSPLTVTPLSHPSSPAHSSTTITHQEATFDENVNMNHMELILHLALDKDKDMYNLGATMDDYHPPALALALDTGLKAPYLLHQMLAFSARRLAFLHPERSAAYLHQAVALQTRAVSLFNAGWNGINNTNCVAVLLFTSALGHHVLADTLAKRDSGGLDAFMTHYIHCVEMHRGVYTVATTNWPILMGSKELGPILSWSSGYNSRSPKGDQCHLPLNLIENTSDLMEEGKEACRKAVHYLQIGFDAVLAENEEGNRYQMIVSWPMLSVPNFTSLLASKHPVALVVLSYYALLLHYARSMWQVGDSGAYILNIITEYLGEEWSDWLEYPRQRIEELRVNPAIATQPT